MKDSYILTKEDILKIWQAGARRGYSQRSIMAGATGTDEPDFDAFFIELDKRRLPTGHLKPSTT